MVASLNWKYVNAGLGYLQDDITAVQTSIPIEPSVAAAWPLIADPDQLVIQIWDGEEDPEICWVIANPQTGDLEVIRGRESSNQPAWAAGAEVRVVISAQMWDDLMDRLAALE